MKNSTFVLLFLSITAFGQNYHIEKIDSLINIIYENGIFNGNVLIAKNGKIIYQKEIGFTDSAQEKRLNKNSRMPIGSISKEFNAAGIMLLSEKGKLKLSDKISKYFPELPKWADSIKISQLLQYTSGLPRINESNYDKLYGKLESLQKLHFEPGKGYIYSNANVFLQRRIIEKVSGLDYYDFLKKRLFKKANVSFEIQKDSVLAEDMAGSFDNDHNATTFIHGISELYFTIEDLHNWEKQLHHGKIIKSSSVNILAKSFDKNSESSLGYVSIENGKIIEHYHQGSGNNYEAVLKYDLKDDLMIIVMSNNQNFSAGPIADAIFNIINNKAYKVPKKSIYLDIRGKLLTNFKDGLAFYNKIKSEQNEIYDFDEEGYDLYSTARYLSRREHYDDAIKILHLSAMLDLNNNGGVSYAYTLIGENYLKLDNPSLAFIYLKKAVELDSSNKNAIEMLGRIK